MGRFVASLVWLLMGACVGWGGETLRLFAWERGIGFAAPDDPEMKVFLWFYEWNLFDARRSGPHTPGAWQWPVSVSQDGRRAVTGPEDLRLTAVAREDGADLTLEVTNRSGLDWPALAAIIPCFNPGPATSRNRRLANTNTYYAGQDGLARLEKREIHFSRAWRAALDRLSPDGQFVFSQKWPTSRDNAAEGLLLRESSDGQWVAGIAWDDFLSAQGHNPWECMHLSVRVGPLAQGQSRRLRGRVYLLRGQREDLLRQHRAAAR